MAKRGILTAFLLFFLAVPLGHAQEWTHDSEAIDMSVVIYGYIDIGSKGMVKSLGANVSYSPRTDERQSVYEKISIPAAKETGSSTEFSWQDPSSGRYEYLTTAKVKAYNQVPEVRSKIPFPYTGVMPAEYAAYTKPTQMIDSDNPQIVNMASQLAAGEDDYYAVVFKLAEWVERNITYDLNTLTEDVSQKSSWVLEHRFGVCDELTNLFIGMARSLGIPARFVSGVAYTEANNLSNWGPHAWAEVYFPEYGWVPFDIAYSQFGFIDPTHINLKESADSNDPSVNFYWLGIDSELNPSKLNYTVALLKYEGNEPKRVRISTRFIYPEVGFGSYNLLEVDVENLNDYYVSTFVYVSQVEGVKLFGDYKRHIMLKPREKKKLYWMFQVDENLNSRYEYTFPFASYSFGNVSFVNTFKSGYKYDVYGYSQVNVIMTDKAEEADKIYSSNIDFKCHKKNSSYPDYVGDSADINCAIRNTGNQFINAIAVCLENAADNSSKSSSDNCQYISLGITQEKKVDFAVLLSRTGSNYFRIKASNAALTKTDSVNIYAKDYPKIEIADIKAPETVKYGETFGISLTLKKESGTGADTGTLSLVHEGIGGKWQIDDIEKDVDFKTQAESLKLNDGENNILARFSYLDERGNSYEKEKSFKIVLEELTFWQKIDRFFKRLFS